MEKKLDGVSLLKELNALGGENGIGRDDILENRLVGMKSHGVYETPGGTILYRALEELKTVVLDKDSMEIMHGIANTYANIIYNGKYYTNLRESLDLFIKNMMKNVTGKVKLALYKGNMILAGKESPYSLYSDDLASFTTGESYSHKDAEGFINLFGLQIGIEANVNKKNS